MHAFIKWILRWCSQRKAPPPKSWVLKGSPQIDRGFEPDLTVPFWRDVR